MPVLARRALAVSRGVGWCNCGPLSTGSKDTHMHATRTPITHARTHACAHARELAGLAARPADQLA
eukprot:11045856-Alexandrium_andersonii.AAC.1